MVEKKMNFVCLGQTVPERSKKYGLRVCTAGVDMDTFQLVRIYPLGVRKDEHFKRWTFYHDLPVRRNPKDNRDESWRLNIPIDVLKNVTKSNVSKKSRSGILTSLLTSETVSQLNQLRKSLAIVQMNDCKGYFVDKGKNFVNVRQFCLFPEIEVDDTFGKSSFSLLPRLKWKDWKGKQHDYMLNSWDAYMHQVHLGEKYGKDDLWRSLRIDKNIPKIGLIGNMNTIRTAWLIITVF